MTLVEALAQMEQISKLLDEVPEFGWHIDDYLVEATNAIDEVKRQLATWVQG